MPLRPAHLLVPLALLVLATVPNDAMAFGSGVGGRDTPEPSNGPGAEGDRSDHTPDGLRFWTWQEPLGLAQSDPRFRWTFRKSTNRPPEVMAQWASNHIGWRQAGEGDVCIILQNFGMGGGDPAYDNPDLVALFEHWCDGIAHTPVAGSDHGCELIASSNASQKWWYTPWMSNGIAECRAWMERFVHAYKMLQQRDPDLPDPARFHFDVEHGAVPQRNGTLLAFVAMQDDPRWFTEPVPGHQGRTMAQLYAEAGSPPVDPYRSYFHMPNREWAKWYAGLCRQAMDGAMDEAAYQVIREAWPDCQSSNYGRSARYDGQGEPARVMRSNGKPWLVWTHDAFADIQAPVCYWAWADWLEAGKSYGDATVRRARTMIDANIHSFDGPHWNIAPWIISIGTLTDDRDSDGGHEHLMTPAVTLDLLTMMRSRGIQEYIVWGTSEAQQPHLWNMLMDVVDRVWRLEPESYELLTGVGQGDDLEQLRLARRDPMTIQSRANPDAAGNMAALAVNFAGEPGQVVPHGFAVTVEATSNLPGTLLKVFLRNVDNGTFEEIGRTTILTGPETRRHTLETNHGERFVNDDGTVEMIAEFHRSVRFVVNVDTVQVVPLSPLDELESDEEMITQGANR